VSDYFARSGTGNAAESMTRKILEKIIQNTVRATEKGLMTYYDPGIDYFCHLVPIKNDFSLDALYAATFLITKICAPFWAHLRNAKNCQRNHQN